MRNVHLVMSGSIGVPARSASVRSAFRFAELAMRNMKTGSDVKAVVRTVQVVRDDLDLVERLLSMASVRTRLASAPERLPWVRSAIENTTSALDDFGRWVECASTEQQSVDPAWLDTRAQFIFNDHERLLNRRTELMACHQQLSNVLNYLNRLEDPPFTKGLPTYQSTTFFDDIVSRHNQKIQTYTETMSSKKQSDAQMSQPIFDYTANTSEYSLPPVSGTSSPPPTYVSAIQSNNTWAYNQAENYGNIPELPGDTICMSGINSSGPVDPYELHNTPSCLELRAPLARNNEDSIAELLGDLSFVPELPGSNAKTPRKLNGLIRGTSNTSRSGPSTNRVRSYGFENNISELPATSKHRPTPSHSVSEPNLPASELPAMSLKPPCASASLSPNSYLSARKQDPIDRRWSSSTGPSCWPGTSTAGPGQQEKHLSPDTTRPSSAHERPLSLQVQQPTNASRSARMHRQKEMLDLLENIERR